MRHKRSVSTRPRTYVVQHLDGGEDRRLQRRQRGVADRQDERRRVGVHRHRERALQHGAEPGEVGRDEARPRVRVERREDVDERREERLRRHVEEGGGGGGRRRDRRADAEPHAPRRRPEDRVVVRQRPVGGGGGGRGGGGGGGGGIAGQQEDLLEALERGERHLSVLAECGGLDELEQEGPGAREVSCGGHQTQRLAGSLLGWTPDTEVSGKSPGVDIGHRG